jgi:hypothetical protein
MVFKEYFQEFSNELFQQVHLQTFLFLNNCGIDAGPHALNRSKAGRMTP